MNQNGKTRKQDNPEQSRRFEEKAREIGADESGKSFERAFTTVIPARKARVRSKKQKSP
jgi:hypothetical protein